MTSPACPACGHATWTATHHGDGSCSRCGYASGEANRCPHCGATARTEGVGPTTVCAVCGGPRIPGGFGGEAATSALKEQKKHLADARLASFATIVQGLFATIATLIGLAVMPAAIVGKLFILAIAIVPVLLALRSRSRANTAREKAKEANDRAWQAAAEDVAAKAKEDGVTAAGLAKTLQIEPARADQLLTALAVHDRTRIDVGDDAEVRYSVASGLRVDSILESSDARKRDEDTEIAPAGKRTEREPAR
jgi:hypothetical protein